MKATLRIELDDAGQVKIQSTTQDYLLLFGLMEVARNLLHKQQAAQIADASESRVVPVRGVVVPMGKNGG